MIMALVYENDCCGCATESYPCLGEQCPRTHVPHLYCDECHEEYDELYYYDDLQLCKDCLVDKLEKISLLDWREQYD